MSMTMTSPLLRQSMLLAMGTLLALALSPAGPAAARDKPGSRGLEAPNQPVVQRTHFIFDVAPDGYDGLSAPERRRLLDWFEAIDLGYGDSISVSDAGGYGRPQVTAAVAGLVGEYGLFLADRAPVTAGEAPAGSIRVIVSRSTASVPGCPGWTHQHEADFKGGLTGEYGCAVNGNLAAMIANPEDLVQGRESRSALRGLTSNRAIKAFRDAAPSGGGGANLK